MQAGTEKWLRPHFDLEHAYIIKRLTLMVYALYLWTPQHNTQKLMPLGPAQLGPASFLFKYYGWECLFGLAWH